MTTDIDRDAIIREAAEHVLDLISFVSYRTGERFGHDTSFDNETIISNAAEIIRKSFTKIKEKG